MKRIILIAIVISVAGCMTNKSFVARMAAMQPAIDKCQENVLSLAQANKVGVPEFADPKDALIWALIMLQKEDENFDSCNQIALAAMSNDARLRERMIAGGITLTSLGIGAIALDSAFDSMASLGKSKGASTITNSRVVTMGDGNKGAHVSASGETHNFGNVDAVNGSQAQGGIQPRQVQIRDTETFDAPSQSGTDEGLDISPGDDIMNPIEPEPEVPLE